MSKARCMRRVAQRVVSVMSRRPMRWMARIDQTWQFLAPVYSAPESFQLLTATGPVRSISVSVGEDLQDAAAALRAYATETADIQSRLEVALRADASTLAATYGSVQDESTTVTLDDRGAQIGAAVAAQMAAWEEAQRRCAAALQAGEQRATG